ncbi:(E)-4-hydroxy-3-methylbut-2-enyl-diphosphate synthase [Deltaproteobacteria bacterium TL4]
MSPFKVPLAYQRRLSRVVSVGNVKIGGTEPICVQSMLTSDTSDAPACLKEIETLAAAQCGLIRLTVPNQKSLEAIPVIRKGMQDLGIEIPLVADIHFSPQLALDSCEFFEKIRINPGNYVDRKRFEIREYSDQQYQEELNRLKEALAPLIKRLVQYKRAIRIGTNHGSLADRIINRYGDTPEGMVESALEFLRIFKINQFHDLIISMKASNPLVMRQAYHLLVQRMDEEAMDYPLHLGVTEAGDELEGRTKSAIGIGGLLCDGIGDTLRVSLTEPAENEIPEGQKLIQGIEALISHSFQYPHESLDIAPRTANYPASPVSVGQIMVGGDATFKFFETGNSGTASNIPNSDAVISTAQLSSLTDFSVHNTDSAFIVINDEIFQKQNFNQELQRLHNLSSACILLVESEHPLFVVRNLVKLLKNQGTPWPLGIQFPASFNAVNWRSFAMETGALIADGLLACVVAPEKAPEFIQRFIPVLLQATRVRLYKADFISCPSCGRTHFDLKATTQRIKERTRHLTGVKIGIMGCIVNGPGEMADADFGYVGVGKGKISLYHGQNCVNRGISAEEAVDHLIALIKEKGRWLDP